MAHLPLLISVFTLTLLLCLHLFLAFAFMIKNGQLRKLNNKWRTLQTQRMAWDEFNKEYAIMSDDALMIRKLADQRINWAQILNKLSLNLPSGIWFNELSLASGELTLQGSVISLEKEEIGSIKKFIDNLKSDAAFFKGFNKIELFSAKARALGGYEIFDFVLTGSLKPDITAKSEGSIKPK